MSDDKLYHPNMTPQLSRELASLAQSMDYHDRTELLLALSDIARAAAGQVVTSLDDSVVPERARDWIKSQIARVSVPNGM